MTSVLKTVGVSALMLATASVAYADSTPLMSAGALAFDNTNTLFIGDGKAGIVHAFNLAESELTNTHRSAASYTLETVASAEAMPYGEGVHPLFGIGGAEYTHIPISGVVHLDTIDDTWAVTIRKNPETPRVPEMHTLAMPMFFERSDHWPCAA
ncbi:MAG: hypothetical protein AAGB10_16920 [Pseudomonadota bacterium]